MVMGWLKLGALVRYIPVSIVIGFTNGIAVLIGLSQLKDLLGLRIDQDAGRLLRPDRRAGGSMPAASTCRHAVGVGLACLAIVVLWPKSYTMP
jgi:SulP family sulfate permease